MGSALSEPPPHPATCRDIKTTAIKEKAALRHETCAAVAILTCNFPPVVKAILCCSFGGSFFYTLCPKYSRGAMTCFLCAWPERRRCPRHRLKDPLQYFDGRAHPFEFEFQGIGPAL